ncbi:MAG: STAS domain-containing protein [Gammaproteobacteria bacterium]|jgi:anti-anti-sigma factor|nr:STAS domain-containing protein [Gammaproteobacteria bacterium]
MSKLRQTHQTLMIQGPFDALAAEKLRPEFDRLATSSSGDLTLDLSGVDFIDSSGIGAIVFLYKRMLGQKRRLEVSGLEGQPRDLIRFLRIDRTIPVVERAPAELAHAANGA